MPYRLAGALFAVGLLVVLPAAARAADAALVMFAKPGCGWCEAWERDVGRIYDRTEEAAVLPLRRVDLSQPLPDEYAGLKRVLFTPTFVALRCGREVGRITGYPGEANFYGLLSDLIADLKRRQDERC